MGSVFYYILEVGEIWLGGVGVVIFLGVMKCRITFLIAVVFYEGWGLVKVGKRGKNARKCAFCCLIYEIGPLS